MLMSYTHSEALNEIGQSGNLLGINHLELLTEIEALHATSDPQLVMHLHMPVLPL